MVKELSINRKVILFTLAVLVISGCNPRDYTKLPAFSKRNFLRAVIEIPAGSNLYTHYCQSSHRFLVDMDEGKEYKVHYLPFPANFGFIPSTRIGKLEEEGRMIDVIVVSHRLGTGTVIEIVPVGMLVLKDDIHTDYKILGIPAHEADRAVNVDNFQELNEKHPEMTIQLENWLLNSGLYNNPVVIGWEDEHVARNFINKWIVEEEARSIP